MVEVSGTHAEKESDKDVQDIESNLDSEESEEAKHVYVTYVSFCNIIMCFLLFTCCLWLINQLKNNPVVPKNLTENFVGKWIPFNRSWPFEYGENVKARLLSQ